MIRTSLLHYMNNHQFDIISNKFPYQGKKIELIILIDALQMKRVFLLLLSVIKSDIFRLKICI